MREDLGILLRDFIVIRKTVLEGIRKVRVRGDRQCVGADGLKKSGIEMQIA